MVVIARILLPLSAAFIFQPLKGGNIEALWQLLSPSYGFSFQNVDNIIKTKAPGRSLFSIIISIKKTRKQSKVSTTKYLINFDNY